MTARYRAKPREITARRWLGWFSDADPAVQLDSRGTRGDQPLLCSGCGQPHHDHGEIETKQGLVTVCPGDWLITTADGETYPCKPDVFDRNYEPAAPPAPRVPLAYGWICPKCGSVHAPFVQKCFRCSAPPPGVVMFTV